MSTIPPPPPPGTPGPPPIILPTPTSVIPPKRGGIHSRYDTFVGGCAMDDHYRLINPRSYKFTTQLRNSKATASLEKTLMSARNDASSIKFNGKLELTDTTTETAELDKEQFIAALKDKVKFHGVQTFFYFFFFVKRNYKGLHLYRPR
jgi:hypothetical protein